MNSIKMYWRYLLFVLDHKRRVYQEGRRLVDKCGRWQLLVHDLSKFSLAEFPHYARNFYGKDYGKKPPRAAAGESAFDRAWLHHVHKNPHHWDHWVLRVGKEITALRMPEHLVREMAADWLALAARMGKSKVEWYSRNKDTIHMHPQTRSRIETLIGYKAPQQQVMVVAGVTNANGRTYSAELLAEVEQQRNREVL